MEFSELVTQTQDLTTIITFKVVWPLIIIFLGISAGKIGGNIIRALGKSTELDKHTKGFLGQRLPITELLAGSMSVIIYTLATVWALVEAGIALWTMRIIGGFFALLMLIAFLLWIADFFPDISRYWHAKRKYKRDTRVTIHSFNGVVQRTTPGHVELMRGNEIIAIPNRSLK